MALLYTYLRCAEHLSQNTLEQNMAVEKFCSYHSEQNISLRKTSQELVDASLNQAFLYHYIESLHLYIERNLNSDSGIVKSSFLNYMHIFYCCGAAGIMVNTTFIKRHFSSRLSHLCRSHEELCRGIQDKHLSKTDISLIQTTLQTKHNRQLTP